MAWSRATRNRRCGSEPSAAWSRAATSIASASSPAARGVAQPQGGDERPALQRGIVAQLGRALERRHGGAQRGRALLDAPRPDAGHAERAVGEEGRAVARDVAQERGDPVRCGPHRAGVRRVVAGADRLAVDVDGQLRLVHRLRPRRGVGERRQRTAGAGRGGRRPRRAGRRRARRSACRARAPRPPPPASRRDPGRPASHAASAPREEQVRAARVVGREPRRALERGGGDGVGPPGAGARRRPASSAAAAPSSGPDRGRREMPGAAVGVAVRQRGGERAMGRPARSRVGARVDGRAHERVVELHAAGRRARTRPASSATASASDSAPPRGRAPRGRRRRRRPRRGAPRACPAGSESTRPPNAAARRSGSGRRADGRDVVGPRRELEQRQRVAGGRRVQAVDAVGGVAAPAPAARPRLRGRARRARGRADRCRRAATARPPRTASTTAMGSASSRRSANRSASALESSSQCASSTSTSERRDLRLRGEQAQRRRADGEPVAAAARPQRQRPAEGRGLRPRDLRRARRAPGAAARAGRRTAPPPRTPRLARAARASPPRVRRRASSSAVLPMPASPTRARTPLVPARASADEAVERRRCSESRPSSTASMHD